MLTLWVAPHKIFKKYLKVQHMRTDCLSVGRLLGRKRPLRLTKRLSLSLTKVIFRSTLLNRKIMLYDQLLRPVLLVLVVDTLPTTIQNVTALASRGNEWSSFVLFSWRLKPFLHYLYAVCFIIRSLSANTNFTLSFRLRHHAFFFFQPHFHIF